MSRSNDAKSLDLIFEGTKEPVRFADDAQIKDFVDVVHGWPYQPIAATANEGLRVARHGQLWRVSGLQPSPWERDHDPVNAICDLIVELNWLRLRAQSELMCLHAGAVELGGGLVVFPNGRRAGKSTLAVELARRGHRLFSDDILAVNIDTEGRAVGLSMGVAPRLRLPLPAGASRSFTAWVAEDPGPSNRQYKYLTTAPIASSNTAVPLAAIAVLDRVEDDIEPEVTLLTPAEAIPLLIHQNFGRFVNAGRALSTFDAVTRGLPCFRLRYGNFARAADFLEWSAREGHFKRGVKIAKGLSSIPDFGNAQSISYDTAQSYVQRVGYTEVNIAGETYVADPAGVGIFRLNTGMVPVWRLLERGMFAADIASILTHIYPDVAEEALLRDVAAGMEALASAGLIKVA